MRGSDEWERDRDLVMYRGCVYVPKGPQLHHDSVMTGHPGWWKTLELVSHNYWWLGISHYVASYMAGCDACNRCRWDIGSLYDPPPGPTFKGLSIVDARIHKSWESNVGTTNLQEQIAK